MGVYQYLLSGKKRSVAIECYKRDDEGVQHRGDRLKSQKATLMLFPFGYKFGRFNDDDERYIDRKENAAQRAKEKQLPSFHELGSNEKALDEKNWEGRWNVEVSHLCIHADSWDEVEIGDEVFVWDGRTQWTDTTRGMKAYGYIVGRRGNGQLVIGSGYHDPQVRSRTVWRDGESYDETYRTIQSLKSFDQLVELGCGYSWDELREKKPEGMFHHDENVIITSTVRPKKQEQRQDQQQKMDEELEKEMAYQAWL